MPSKKSKNETMPPPKQKKLRPIASGTKPLRTNSHPETTPKEPSPPRPQTLSQPAMETRTPTPTMQETRTPPMAKDSHTPPPPKDTRQTPPPPKDTRQTPPPPKDTRQTSPPPKDTRQTPPPPKDTRQTLPPPKNTWQTTSTATATSSMATATSSTVPIRNLADFAFQRSLGLNRPLPQAQVSPQLQADETEDLPDIPYDEESYTDCAILALKFLTTLATFLT